MRIVPLGFMALPLLAACATTPLQQCMAPHRAELRTVEADMRNTAQALSRGFRLVPARFDFGVHHCVTRTGRVHLCRSDDEGPYYDKRPINRAAETAKLKALRAERARLDAAMANCAIRYPE